MEGYWVIIKDSDDEESKKLKAILKESKLVDLQCTRTFNRITNNEFKKQAGSAVTQIRNRQEEKVKKRKEYQARPDVKQRSKEYNQQPEVKERKRQDRVRKQKLLSLVPKEIVAKVYKEASE
jgi:hypothetical protein